MNPFFNEDHESIREMARDFAEKTLAPIAAEVDKTEHFPEDVVKQMADLGFLGLKIPEEYGGLGLDMRSYVCVMEEIAKKCATATLFISSANSLSTAPIVISGTDEQKAKYLPGVAAGEEYIAFGLTEPNAGSDAASMTTKAVEDGDCYILNGRKCFITMAPISGERRGPGGRPGAQGVHDRREGPGLHQRHEDPVRGPHRRGLHVPGHGSGGH